MRVAVLSYYGFEMVKGGTELFTEQLRRAFPDLVIITFKDSGRTSLPILDRLNLKEVWMGASIGRHFRRLCKEEGFDLILCNSTAGWWLSIFRPRAPMVNVFHYTSIGFAEGTLRGTPGFLPTRYMMPLLEKLTSFSKHNVAVSPKVQRELADRYGIRSQVIVNGVDVELFAPRDKVEARRMLGIEHDGPMAIFVGRADRTKGFDLVREVAARREDLRVLCVTSSEVEGKNLIVRRNVPHDLMPLHYCAADLLLFPTHYEACSYTPFEAMACDVPVVTSRTGIFEDLEDDRVGVVVPSFDVEHYLAAIDEVLARELHPRTVVMESFSLERFAEQYREMATRLVAERSKR
jgi:glycosyltransferase involved in cell wall biosynthesis